MVARLSGMSKKQSLCAGALLLVSMILIATMSVCEAGINARNANRLLFNNKSGCAAFLARHPESAQIVTPEVGNKITSALGNFVGGQYGISDEEVNTFLSSGWPALKNFSLLHGRSLEDLIGEIFGQIAFLGDITGVMSGSEKTFFRSQTAFLNMVRWLDDLKTKNLPLKNSDLQYVRRIMVTLHGVGVFVMGLDLYNAKSTNFNPLLPLSAAQVEMLLSKTETVSEDIVLRIALDKDEERTQRQKQADVAASQAELAEPASEPVSENIAVASTPLLPAADTTIRPTDSPAVTTPIQPSESLIHRQKSLREIIEAKTPMEPGRIYHFKNSKGEDYTIEFSNAVLKVSDSGERPNVLKLLSSLFVGNGIYSGIKILRGHFKHTVEIKASVHGHKRLIGCLEGRHLQIKKFYNIPSTRAAYSRLIPHDLCD